MVRCWSILALFFAWFAMAGELQIDHETPVYAKPSTDSRVLSTLRSGAKLQAGEPVSGFRKVRLPGGRIGYVSEDDLTAMDIPDSSPEFRGNGKPFIIGLYGSGLGLSQGKKSFSTQDEVNYVTSNYSGSAFEGGFFLEHRYREYRAYRVHLGYETVHFKGTATEIDIPTQPLQVSLDETFITLGGDLKYYLGPGGFWLGFGGEYARGLTVKLKLNGNTFPTSESDLANLLVVSGVTGWDFQFGPWSVAPLVRIGDAPFAHPNILIYEGTIQIGHSVSF